MDEEIDLYITQLVENGRWGIAPVQISCLQEYGTRVPEVLVGVHLRSWDDFSVPIDVWSFPPELEKFRITGWMMNQCTKTMKFIKILRQPRYYEHIMYIDPFDNINTRSYASIVTFDLVLQKARNVTLKLQALDETLSWCLLRCLRSKNYVVNGLCFNFDRDLSQREDDLRTTKISLMLLSLAFANNRCVKHVDYYDYGRFHRLGYEHLILQYILNGMRRNPCMITHLRIIGNPTDAAIEELAAYVHHRQCELQVIHLRGIRLTEFLYHIQHIKNETLQRLEIVDCTPSEGPYEDSHLENLYNIFPNLIRLAIAGIPIRDLRNLRRFWRDEESKLIELVLADCDIDENAIMRFSAEIPAMKTLKLLCLDWNPFIHHDSWQDTFESNFLQNTSIRRLKIDSWSDTNKEVFCHQHLNRITQLIGQPEDALKTKLLPIIIYRVARYSENIQESSEGDSETIIYKFFKMNLLEILTNK